MAYQSGDNAAAVDYNALVGTPTGTPTDDNKTIVPFINDAEALDTVAGMFGIGYGEAGYGQTNRTLVNKIATETVSGANWKSVRGALSTCASHQGSSVTNLIPETNFDVGEIITAHDGIDNPNDSLSDLVTPVFADIGLTNGGASMSLTSDVINDTRGSTWSGTITVGTRFQWGSVDEARFFFNSGGELRTRLEQGTNSTPQDDDWATIFSTILGTFSFKKTTSAITGTGTADLTATIGFYDIANSDSYTTIYNGLDIGAGAYSANDLIIQARIPATGSGVVTGEHGAPGNTVDILVTLQDQHSGDTDLVSAGTKMLADVFRATVVLNGITAPGTSIYNGF